MMIIVARGVNGGPRVAQIAQVGLSLQSKYDRPGKSRCELSVFVQRINSVAQEADLRGNGRWVGEQQSSPPG